MHVRYVEYLYLCVELIFHERWVRATYGVASTYVLADTYDKGVKQSKVQLFWNDHHHHWYLHCTPNQEPGADTSKVAIAAVDTLLWQALASVIVPGFPHHHDISRGLKKYLFLPKISTYFYQK